MIQFDEQLVSAALEAPDDQAVEMMEGFFIVNDHHVLMVCVCGYFEEIYRFGYLYIYMYTVYTTVV